DATAFDDQRLRRCVAEHLQLASLFGGIDQLAGDPATTEGGQIEWGYYEATNTRMCHPRDILEKHEARLSPSKRDLE
ncbi:hypothetical protein ACC760_40190, partial [Rhizobium ruizarguesonis]